LDLSEISIRNKEGNQSSIQTISMWSKLRWDYRICKNTI